MQNLLSELTNFIGQYLTGLESLLSMFYHIPVYNYNLGDIIIFFVICSFIFSILIYFLRGGNSD